MNARRKSIVLDSLRRPGIHLIRQALEEAKLFAWRQSNNGQADYDLERFFEALQHRLCNQKQRGCLSWFRIEHNAARRDFTIRASALVRSVPRNCYEHRRYEVTFSI